MAAPPSLLPKLPHAVLGWCPPAAPHWCLLPAAACHGGLLLGAATHPAAGALTSSSYAAGAGCCHPQAACPTGWPQQRCLVCGASPACCGVVHGWRAFGALSRPAQCLLQEPAAEGRVGRCACALESTTEAGPCRLCNRPPPPPCLAASLLPPPSPSRAAAQPPAFGAVPRPMPAGCPTEARFPPFRGADKPLRRAPVSSGRGPLWRLLARPHPIQDLWISSATKQGRAGARHCKSLRLASVAWRHGAPLMKM